MGHTHPPWRPSNSEHHAVDDERLIDVGTRRWAGQPQDSKGDGLGAASPKADSDPTLIAECCGGDSRAFNVLVLRHKDSVRTLATRLLEDRNEVEDIMQDTFLRAYEKIEEFRGEAKFSTWLYRICYNLCLNYLQRKKNDPTNDAGDGTLPEELPDPRDRLPDQVLMRKERRNLVTQAFSHMTQEFREVLVLHHTTQLSYEEMAELLGLPVGTVRSRLHRGREELKEHLRPYL